MMTYFTDSAGLMRRDDDGAVSRYTVRGWVDVSADEFDPAALGGPDWLPVDDVDAARLRRNIDELRP
jgi:hypothetical protein